MKRKILSITMALVLLFSMSLMAAPVSAVDPPSYAGYTLSQGVGDATAKWSIEKSGATTGAMGEYSVELFHNAGTDSGDVHVEFTPPPGIEVSDLQTTPADWGFWYFVADAGDWGPGLELKFEDPASTDYVDITIFPAQGNEGDDPPEWHVVTGEWHEVVLDADMLTVTYWGPTVNGGASHDTLTDAFTAITLVEADFADWELSTVQAELNMAAEGALPRTVYIDDVTIDGTTYELEPMVLDAEYYSIDEAVGVTVMNSDISANTDPMAIDEVIVAAKSDTDTVGDNVTLTETGSDTGVFTGEITLVGAAPADRDADEIVVAAEDTVEVTYADGNWGAGVDTIVLTAIVDDTAPEIVIVSPVESANISDNETAIAASYSDAGSDIDTTSVVITVDTVGQTTATVTDSSVTYTPPAPGLADGIHTVTVDVSDLAGNAATTASWSFTVDTEVPVITLQVATPPVILPDDETEVTFTATVTDATSGVASVEIDLSTVGGTADLAMLDDGDAPDATADDGIYTASENITKSSEANYSLTVTATDEALNSDTAVITLGVWTDIVAPVITSPTITYTYGSSVPPGGTVTISANVTDNILMGPVEATADTDPAFAVTLVDDASGVDVTAGDGIYTGEGTVDSGVGLGDYTLTITAEDAKGNETTDETLTLAVDPSPTGVEIELYEGWNLISLPLIPDDADIAVVISIDTLASGNVSSVGIVRGYDPATGLFPYYMPESASGDLTEMSDGAGYWVFIETADTLTVSGKQWPTPPAVPPSYDVVVDWNLIGFKSIVAMDDYTDGSPLTSYLANIEGTYPVLWSYDAEAGAYENVKGADLGMEMGHGFWIWITEAGTIVPPG